MDELDLTEKTPRTFDEDDLRDEVSHLAALTPPRTARGTKSNTALPAARARRSSTAPPPIPPQSRRAATVKPLIGNTTVPPAKLISFLPPPEPQSLMPGSFPVVWSASSGAPPPVPAPRESISTPPPPAARRATTVSPHVVPRAMVLGSDPARAGARSTIGEPLARGSIAPRTPSAMQAPRSSASIQVAVDDVDVPIDVASLAAKVPLVGTPLTGDEHVGSRRSLGVIASVVVGAALVATTLGLILRGGSGTKPAPAPVPAALATAPVEPPPVEPAVAAAPASPPPTAVSPLSRPPAVEVAATTSAVAAAPVEPAEDEPPRIDLPITSQPDGAIVTLIANGDATVVGRTPITASVDPTLTYDVVLALRDHPTMITHVDASKVHELAIDLRPRLTPQPARRRTKFVTAPKAAVPAKSVATKRR